MCFNMKDNKDYNYNSDYIMIRNIIIIILIVDIQSLQL